MNKTKLFTKNILFSTQGFLLALITLIAITCLCLRVTVFNCNFHSTLFLRHNVCIHTYNYLNDQIDHFSDYVSNNNNPDPFENDLIKVIKSSLSLRFVTLNLDTIRNEMFSYFYGDREFLPDVSFPNISNSDIEKIAKHIPSSSFKTLKKINLSTILMTFEFNDIINKLLWGKFIFFLIFMLPSLLFMIVLTIFFINLVFIKSAHSMCILIRHYLISLGILSIITGSSISIVLHYLVKNHLFIRNVPMYFLDMLSNYTINIILPTIIVTLIIAIISFIFLLFLKKIQFLLRITQNISFIKKLENKHSYLLYPIIFIIIFMCLSYKINSFYVLIISNFKNILYSKEAIVAAQEDTIYNIRVTLLDAKTKMPVHGVAVSMSGISTDGKYFSTISKSNSDGSISFSANKGHFYLDFISDLFPPEYILPKRTKINFDTAKTTNVLIKLRNRESTTQNGFGTVSISLLDLNNKPYPNISLCLTSTTDSSKKIYSVSNAHGTSIFNAQAGIYTVDTMKETFPLDKYILPEKFNVSIQEGVNCTYTLQLIPKP